MEKATRDAFGEALLELGKNNERIVALSADLQDSTKAIHFQKEFPERFVNVGIAEQDLIGIAAGYALEGFIPYVSSFASFLTTRPFDMIRILACYNNINIKIVATHTGVTVGEDGGSAQMLEDIAIMRSLTNMVVLCPADAVETKKMVDGIAKYDGPVYLRLARAKYPFVTDESLPFEMGKGQILREGGDVSLVGTGLMVSKALEASEVLADHGIEARVINMSSIKPIDKNLLVKCAKETGRIVTLEEHQVTGGLGSAVCEVIAQNYPVPVKIIGVDDRFGQSGKPEELLKEYGLDMKSIVKNVIEFIGG